MLEKPPIGCGRAGGPPGSLVEAHRAQADAVGARGSRQGRDTNLHDARQSQPRLKRRRCGLHHADKHPNNEDSDADVALHHASKHPNNQDPDADVAPHHASKHPNNQSQRPMLRH